MKNPAPEALRRRARRAELLADTQPAAEAPLRFAAGLYDDQARAAEHLLGTGWSGQLQVDADRIFAASDHLLERIVDTGPSGLSEEAQRWRGEERFLGPRRIAAALAPGPREGSPRAYLVRALLRPYLEARAGAGEAPFGDAAPPGACPFCNGPPWIAARRSTGASDGAARVLGCARCGTEWRARRIFCSVCGETDPVKLPIFQGDAFPTARIEACESCGCYLKSLDLTVDARPIPEVDDLLSLALDLWAQERGLIRIEPGLAGI